MSPPKLLILFLLISFTSHIKAQSKSQGEGIISVVLFNRTTSDSLQDNNVLFSYRYFIKGTKVLRKDSVINKKTHSRIINDTIKAKDLTLHTSINLTVVHPVYLIDLENQQAFTFYKFDSQLYISVDTLDKHFQEVFYKPSAKKKEATFQYLPDILPKIIAGKTCFAAKWMYRGDTNYLRYTKEPMTLKSPLNMFVPDFPYPILSLDAKSSKYKTGEFEANVSFLVTDLQEINLAEQLFMIPDNAILKYNVPLKEMVNGLDILKRDIRTQ